MDFFGIGAPELILILLILFIFFGPTRLPEIAAMLGKAMRKLKQASAEMNRNLQEISDEIKESGKDAAGDVSGDKGLIKELKDAGRELTDAAKDVKESAQLPALKKDLRDIAGDVSSAARPAATPKKDDGPANSPNEES